MSSWDEAGAARTASAPVKSGRAVQLRIKRVIDVVAAIVALVALGPLFLFVAVAIKLDGGGPVFIRQPRLGRAGKPFASLNFRTMPRDRDRQTRTGRFLRTTGIEALPQFFNVLTGDMSLVGPRPHAPGAMVDGKAYGELVPYYDARLDMAPGLTGWAQANGLCGSARDAQQARAWIDRDLEYIENFNIALDLRIIGGTLWRELVAGSGK